MQADVETFAATVAELLARFARQNAQAVPPPATLAMVGTHLWALLEVRGWPRPLAPGDKGEPGEMATAEVEPLVAHLRAGLELEANLFWSGPLRQLVKACFHPWFRTCRESYHEVDDGGTCRRQDFGRANQRLSGSHCVDCPYWTTLTPPQHEALLRRHWRTGRAEEFAAHQTVFLPEDFRRLRLLLEAKTRGIKP